VSAPQFFETRMGRQYYEVTLPELVRQISRLSDLLALGVEQMEQINTARPTGVAPDGPASTTSGQG